MKETCGETSTRTQSTIQWKPDLCSKTLTVSAASGPFPRHGSQGTLCSQRCPPEGTGHSMTYTETPQSAILPEPTPRSLKTVQSFWASTMTAWGPLASPSLAPFLDFCLFQAGTDEDFYAETSRTLILTRRQQHTHTCETQLCLQHFPSGDQVSRKMMTDRSHRGTPELRPGYVHSRTHQRVLPIAATRIVRKLLKTILKSLCHGAEEINQKHWVLFQRTGVQSPGPTQ